MHEIFPVAAGVLVGLLAFRVASSRLRALLIAGLSVVFGVIATIISGEALISWAFVLIDIPLVLGSAIVTLVAVTYWTQRSIQLR
ncbi:MAG: hypothetical protein QJR03_00235 [Sphaerobacter sp.]|nr:hypothetical protein [Sphaerobacter sp.]